MFFHIRELELKARPFDVTLAPGELEFFDPKLRQKGALVATGKAELIVDALHEIRVQGHLKVLMESDCDRCLESAEFPVEGDFELFYRPLEDGLGEEKVLDKSEAEMGFYDNGGVELNDVLREYVLLSLPMQKVCREDCLGICPVCGQNRNQQNCECETQPLDERWAALKNLNQ